MWYSGINRGERRRRKKGEGMVLDGGWKNFGWHWGLRKWWTMEHSPFLEGETSIFMQIFSVSFSVLSPVSFFRELLLAFTLNINQIIITIKTNQMIIITV